MFDVPPKRTVGRSCRSLILLLLASAPLNNAAAQVQPKSPTALQAIGQMQAATGWSLATVPSTILASGQLTRASGQLSSFVTKQRGSYQHRFDLQEGSTTATTIVNGLAGLVILPDGKKQRLLAHASLSIQSPAFPFLTDLLKTSDPAVEVNDLGTSTIDGVPCQGVLVARHAQSNDLLRGSRDLAAPLKVWLSQQTGLPVRVDFIRLAHDNQFVAMHFSRSFSDYRPVNGVAVAFTQEERFEGQSMYRIQFTNIQFGAAMSDSDFALPTR